MPSEPKRERLTPEQHVLRYFTSAETSTEQIAAMMDKLGPLIEYRLGRPALPGKPGRKRKVKDAPLLEVGK